MSAALQLGVLPSGQPETLVLYAYSNTDTEYERNLHYFVEHGVAEGDGCDYIIIVQEVRTLPQPECQSPLLGLWISHVL